MSYLILNRQPNQTVNSQFHAKSNTKDHAEFFTLWFQFFLSFFWVKSPYLLVIFACFCDEFRTVRYNNRYVKVYLNAILISVF